jgi:hypothetical protein
MRSFKHFCHDCNVAFHRAVDFIFHHNEYHIKYNEVENTETVKSEWPYP